MNRLAVLLLVVAACAPKDESLFVAWPGGFDAASAVVLVFEEQSGSVLVSTHDGPFDAPLSLALSPAWNAVPSSVNLAIAEYTCTLDQLGYGSVVDSSPEALAPTNSTFVRRGDEAAWSAQAALPAVFDHVTLERRSSCTTPVIESVALDPSWKWIARWGADGALVGFADRLERVRRDGTLDVVTSSAGVGDDTPIVLQRSDDTLFLLDRSGAIRTGLPGEPFVMFAQVPDDGSALPLIDVGAAVSASGPLELMVATSRAVHYFTESGWRWTRVTDELRIVRWGGPGRFITWYPDRRRAEHFNESGERTQDQLTESITDMLYVAELGLVTSATDGTVFVRGDDGTWGRLDLQGSGTPATLVRTKAGFALVERFGFVQPYVAGTGFCAPIAVGGSGLQYALERPGGLLHVNSAAVTFIDLRTRRDCPRDAREP